MSRWNWTTKDSAVLEIFATNEIAMVVSIRRIGNSWRARVAVDDNIASQVDQCNSPEEAARIALDEAVHVADDLLDAARAAVGTKLPPTSRR